MARAKTGSVAGFVDERGRARYRIAVTLPDGTRRSIRLPPGMSEARARETVQVWNERVGELVRDLAPRVVH